MKKILAIVLSIALMLSFCGCTKKTPVAEITMEDGSVISAELYPDIAPISVENFINLANEGFYDGITVHRVVPGFVIQAGDPDGDGTGGSGKTIKGEFSANGVENALSHTRGVLSMARLGNDFDSATSQFFIVLEDSDFLDGNYAAFGKVTEGMDTVDEIATKPTDHNDKPLEDVVIKSIKITYED